MDMTVRQADTTGVLVRGQIIDSPIPVGMETGSSKCGTRTTLDEALEDVAVTEAPAAVAPVRQARPLDYFEPWPMQKIVTDMVEFAEELHRGLLAVAGIGQAPASKGLPLTLMQLEAKLERLLTRSGVERDDPTGSTFDPTRHQKIAEDRMSDEIPGTVVRALSSTWTLNGQLLRPAMVIISAVSPVDIITGANSFASSMAIEGQIR